MGLRPERIRSELLVLRYRRGDKEALEEIVNMWERPLFYYIRRLVDSEEDAWDALQQVWLRAVRKIGKLREPRALPTWLYKIAHNVIVSQWRKARPFDPLPEGADLPDTAGGTDFHSLPALDAREVHWALGKLTPAHCEVLTLHFLESFSVAEIGEITRVSVGTVKSRLHYAKKALREVLEEEAQRHE